MAAFSDTAFSTSAFSVAAFSFGTGPTPPPVVVVTDQQIIGGGAPARSRLSLKEGRTRDEVRRDRERFGIPAAVEEVVMAVATRQAEALAQDEQQRFEELTRELKLRELEYDARYLQSMNVARQRLIDAEIGRLLKQKDDEEIMAMLMMIAAVA